MHKTNSTLMRKTTQNVINRNVDREISVASKEKNDHMVEATRNIINLSQQQTEPHQKTTLGDNLAAIGHSFLTGLADVGSSLYEAADFIIPNEAVSQIFGAEDKVEKFFDARRADKAAYHAENDRLNAKASPTVAAVNNYVVRPVANMLPAAALAVATGGSSLAGSVATGGAAALGGASAATGTAAAVKTATTQLLKSPNFWLSFGQISGNTYSDAMENGASEGQAVYTALTNGVAGSLIELGGGIEKGGQGNWFVNTIEEVGEEVSQGWVENGISAVVYDQDKEWFSLTDPDAVFSATRAGQEVLGTVAAAGVMNAGQMGAVKVNQYVQASRIGSEYLNGTDGKTLQGAIEIGLANAPSMDAYKAAQKIQQKVNAGQEVSPYLVGRMVAESFSPEAQLARQLDALVANTGEALGVRSETIDAVAAVAVRTGRRVEFATPEQITAANNVSVASGVGGLYNRDTNTIYVSSALSTDEAVDFVLKHEITHSIETTQAWSRMENLARQAMGEEAYTAAVREVMAQRQAVGDTTGATETGAKKEVIADWVGKNLWENNFAAIVAAKDKGLANKLALTMWNIRRGLSFTENGRQTARVKYAEQLLMKAIEDTARTDPALELNTPSDPSGGQYSVEYLREKPNGDIIDLLKKVESGEYKQNDTASLGTVDSATVEKIHQITGIDVTGWKVAIEARQLKHILKRHGKNGAADRSMADETDIAKMEYALHNAEHIVDGGESHAYTNFVNGKDRPAKTVLYQKDIGGVYYYVVQAVPDTKRKTLFVDSAFINKTKKVEDQYSANALSPSETPESASTVSSTNTNVPQNALGVNTQSMQNGEKNSSSGQLSFLPPEIMEQESGRKGKPDVYQEDGERKAYLAEDALRRRKQQSGATEGFVEDEGFTGLIGRLETLSDDGYIRVGEIIENSPLHRVGMNAGKLYFDVSKIKRSLARHSDHLSPHILKKIPQLLQNPIAITEYRPGKGTNTVNVYGELYYRGHPIVVGIVATVGRDNTIISKVRTVHARSNFIKQITDDSILYLGENKNETDRWFQAQGQLVPMRGTTYGFIRSITDTVDFVKPTAIDENGELDEKKLFQMKDEFHQRKAAIREADRQSRIESNRKRGERKEWTKKKNQAQDEVAALMYIVTHPTNDYNIPAELVEPVVDLLVAMESAFDDKADRLVVLKERLRNETHPLKIKALEKRIRNLEENQRVDAVMMTRLKTLYGEYSKDNNASEAYKTVSKLVDRAISMIGERTVYELNADEFDALNMVIRSVMHTAANVNKLYGEQFDKTVQEVGEQLEREARENTILRGGKFTARAKRLLTTQLTPDRLFDALGGFAKESAWKALGMEAIDGQRMMLEIDRRFYEHFKGITEHESFKLLRSTKEKHLVDVGLVDKDGNPIKITHGMMLSLYQIINCPGNRQALMDGGIEIPDMKRYYNGDTANAYAGGTRLSRSAYCESIHEALGKIKQTKENPDENQYWIERLAQLEAQANADFDAIAAKIEELMSDKEREYCTLAREWFDKISKDYINDVTMDVFGFQKAIVENYYPIYRNKDWVVTDFEALVTDITVENNGSLKERVRSKAPVRLADISDMLRNSENNTARYCGFLKFTMDIKRLLNVHTKDMEYGVKDTLRHMNTEGTIGVTPLKYIENLMVDIAGGRQNEKGFIAGLRRNAIRSTMTLNGSVALKQVGAVFTSAGELGWKYQSKAMQHIGSKLDPALVAKYSVYFHARYYGDSGMEEFAAMKQGTNVADRMYRKADELTNGKVFNWCQGMDNATCKLLWHGCVAKINDTRPELEKGSEEYYQAIGKELDRVIQKTQTNYTTMERSDLSRDNRWTMKIFSTYKTDAIQCFNMLFEATARLRRYQKDLAAGKGGVTQADVDDAKKQLADTIPAVMVGGVLWGAFAGMLVNMLMQRTSGYRDETDDLTIESVGNALLSETLSGIAGMVVFGDQLYDIAASRIFGENYYGMSDMGIETLSGLLEDFATGNFKQAKLYKYIVQDMGKVMGLPVKNVWDIAEGFFKHVEDIGNGEFLSLKASANTTDSQYYRRLYKAVQKGDNDKAENIRQFLITCGETEAEIQSGLREAAKAAVKKDDKDFEKQYQAAMKEAMEDMFYRRMREKEQDRVKSGIKSYIADQIVADEIGIEPTKANKKAEEYIENGASIAQYFVANTAKNAVFADKNHDDEVSKAEFRSVMNDAEYDAYIKKLFLGMK